MGRDKRQIDFTGAKSSPLVKVLCKNTLVQTYVRLECIQQNTTEIFVNQFEKKDENKTSHSNNGYTDKKNGNIGWNPFERPAIMTVSVKISILGVGEGG